MEIDWVCLPSGKFVIGTDLNEDRVAANNKWSINSELPQHSIYLPEYYISCTPVTNSQWNIFLRLSGYQWADRDKLWNNGIPEGKENHPVVWVTWYDTHAFCEWANVRLPSEAEWEKAARGIDKRLYPWGNQEPSSMLANYNKKIGGTTQVYQYPEGRSYYGLFDMAGNVWEWTRTLWGTDKDQALYNYPYQVNDGREDDQLDKNILRVVRSSGWRYSSELLRCAARDWNSPVARGSGLGFRIAVNSKKENNKHEY